jgi:hypothetical protein
MVVSSPPAEALSIGAVFESFLPLTLTSNSKKERKEMKSRTKSFQVSLFAIILLTAGFSQARANKLIDTYDFLNFGNGARALGIGRAFVAIADDGTAAYWNPAGLGNLANVELTTMRTRITPNSYTSFSEIGSEYSVLSAIIPKTVIKRGGLGITVIQFSVKDIKKTGINIYGELEELGSFDNKETAYIGSYGGELIKEMIWLGGNAKLMTHSLDELSASGYGFDIGALADLSRILGRKEQKFLGRIFARVKFGVAVQWNLRKKWSGEYQEDPGLLGGQYGLSFEPAIGANKKWLIAIVIDQAQQQPFKVSWGTELQFGKFHGSEFAIRGGIENQYVEHRYQKFMEGHWSEFRRAARKYAFGGGVKISLFTIDYAAIWDRFAIRHRISLGIRF